MTRSNADLRREQWMREALADYERRRRHWWGRLLLWLLGKTT